MNVKLQYYTLEELLNNRIFRIPDYQRTYSWKKEHRHAMFNDIEEIGNKPTNINHFMATVVGMKHDDIVVNNHKYEYVDIVDGQQRITTLVMLLKTIENELGKNPPESELA